ncbi:MAG: HPF/RaiA family ribosome-associated protein [Chloroflexota bacterium]
MTLTITLERHGVQLNDAQEARVRHHLTGLGKRLENRPEPIATLAFAGPNGKNEILVNLRVQLGPLGPTLTSSSAAPTPDRAAHLAIQAVERQLEKLVARQRGEPTYGVPSRRRHGPSAELDGEAWTETPPPADEA